MKTYKVYLTRSDSNDTFLICDKKQKFITSNENEANDFYNKQYALLHSLPQSMARKGNITLHMDFMETNTIYGYSEFDIKSVSVPLSYYSILALEQSK